MTSFKIFLKVETVFFYKNSCKPIVSIIWHRDFLIPIFTTGCCKSLIFQTMNSVRLNSLSLTFNKV